MVPTLMVVEEDRWGRMPLWVRLALVALGFVSISAVVIRLVPNGWVLVLLPSANAAGRWVQGVDGHVARRRTRFLPL